MSGMLGHWFGARAFISAIVAVSLIGLEGGDPGSPWLRGSLVAAADDRAWGRGGWGGGLRRIVGPGSRWRGDDKASLRRAWLFIGGLSLRGGAATASRGISKGKRKGSGGKGRGKGKAGGKKAEADEKSDEDEDDTTKVSSGSSKSEDEDDDEGEVVEDVEDDDEEVEEDVAMPTPEQMMEEDDENATACVPVLVRLPSHKNIICRF